MMELDWLNPSVFGSNYGSGGRIGTMIRPSNNKYGEDKMVLADDLDFQKELTIGNQDNGSEVWIAGSFRREPEWNDSYLPFRVPKSPSIVVEIPSFPQSASNPRASNASQKSKDSGVSGNLTDKQSEQLSLSRKSRRRKKPKVYSPELLHMDEDDYNNMEDEDDSDDEGYSGMKGNEKETTSDKAQHGILPSRGRPDWDSLQRPPSEDEFPFIEKVRTDRFQCKICDNVYDTKRLLKKHTKLRHGKYKNQLIKEKRKKPKASQRRKEEERRRQEEAKRNAKSAVPKDCIVPGCKFKSSTDNEMDRHIAQHYMKLGRSKQKKETSSKSNAVPWRKSLKVPNKEIHSCPLCSYTATVLLSFEIHLSTHITKGRDLPLRFSCDVCGMDLESEEEKLEHFEATHLMGDQGIKCDFCEFQARQLDKVVEHRRKHSNERPHLCPYCGFRATVVYNLKKHMKRKHNSDIKNQTFYPESNYLQEVLEKFGVEEPLSD